MPLTLAEYQLRDRLPRRLSVRQLFDAACLLGWTTTKAIAELAKVSRRRAELELAELVRKGWLVREDSGPQNQQRRVRFSARVAAIAGDRTATIAGDRTGTIVHDRSEPPDPTRRTRARDHAQQKEIRSVPSGSASASASASASERSRSHHRPSVLGGPGGDGRTGESEESRLQTAVDWVHERLGVTPQMSRSGLRRLLNIGASDREVREFAIDQKRGTGPAFDGLEHAKFRFGAACTEDRFLLWRRSREARARADADRAKVEATERVEPRTRAPQPVSEVSAREMEDFVRTLLRR